MWGGKHHVRGSRGASQEGEWIFGDVVNREEQNLRKVFGLKDLNKQQAQGKVNKNVNEGGSVPWKDIPGGDGVG